MKLFFGTVFEAVDDRSTALNVRMTSVKVEYALVDGLEAAIEFDDGMAMFIAVFVVFACDPTPLDWFDASEEADEVIDICGTLSVSEEGTLCIEFERHKGCGMGRTNITLPFPPFIEV